MKKVPQLIWETSVCPSRLISYKQYQCLWKISQKYMLIVGNVVWIAGIQAFLLEIKLIIGRNNINYGTLEIVWVKKGFFYHIRWQLWNRLRVEFRLWRLNNLSVLVFKWISVSDEGWFCHIQYQWLVRT